MSSPSFTELSSIQRLLTDCLGVTAVQPLEFHASWVSRELEWPPERAREILIHLAQPTSGAPWLEAHVRMRCLEHRDALLDLEMNEACPEELDCPQHPGRVAAEDAFAEVYFRPTDELVQHAKKALAHQ